jgi:hypothetical protein
MSDLAPARPGWVLPVLLVVATAAAGGFALLFFLRLGPADLGAIHVVVTDDDGKGGNTLHVIVAEAPLAQKETVSPRTAYTGVVHYPVPYRTNPHLKLTSGKRPYEVVAETPFGFTWVARPLPEDIPDDAKKDAIVKNFLKGSLAEFTGVLKPGLVFEDFTWEARGLRAPPSSLPPQVFEQKGPFRTVHGQQGVVHFPIPYRQAPNVTLKMSGWNKTIVTECTPAGFKWKNTGGDDQFNNESAEWIAKGVR